MKMSKFWPILLLATMLLAACAGRPPSVRPGDDQQSQPPSVVAPVPDKGAAAPDRMPSMQTVPVPAAARSLAARAEKASQVGDHEAAAAYLERALRIAPSHPVLWQNLAVVRY